MSGDLLQSFSPHDIKGYHAHVYYADDLERDVAERIRTAASQQFEIVLGRWRESPVGPHPCPMYQIAFDVALMARFVPWLLSVHGPLSILVHARTGLSDLLDHTAGAMWIGESMALKLDFFDRDGKSA